MKEKQKIINRKKRLFDNSFVCTNFRQFVVQIAQMRMNIL